MKYLQKVRAVIIRKAQGPVGWKIDDVDRAGPGNFRSYLLEIRVLETGQIETIHLELNRSCDYYRLPVGRPVILKIGRYPTRVGRWLNTWSLNDSDS